MFCTQGHPRSDNTWIDTTSVLVSLFSIGLLQNISSLCVELWMETMDFLHLIFMYIYFTLIDDFLVFFLIRWKKLTHNRPVYKTAITILLALWNSVLSYIPHQTLYICIIMDCNCIFPLYILYIAL